MVFNQYHSKAVNNELRYNKCYRKSGVGVREYVGALSNKSMFNFECY